MITGQRVTMTIEGETYPAIVQLGSDNRKSLMLRPDNPVSIGGGVYVNYVPVMGDGIREYTDLITKTPIQITWLDEAVA